MKKWRLMFLQLVFAFLMAAIAARLFYWQIVSYDRFVLAASDQHLTTVRIDSPRGKIFASDGNILVSNTQVYLLFGSITEIKKNLSKDQKYSQKVDEIVSKIVPILLAEQVKQSKEPDKLSSTDKEDLDKALRDTLTKRLSSETSVWVTLAKKISPASRDKLKALNIPGLGFEDQSKRFYPEGALGSAILGFVGKDSDDNDKGYFGLEGYYENQIQGRSGTLTQEIDASGKPIIAGETTANKPKEGFDIETTIDRTVQYTVEKYLYDASKKFGAKQASALVLDPKTGAVLAMANTPNYDPNKWNQYDEKDRRNFAISDVYEPGSTFKLVTAAAALDAGVVKPDTLCPCEGPIKVSGYEVQTWNNKYSPNSNMAQILEHSDNVGAAFWAQKLGRDKFLKYLNSFGFGIPSGIDLQGEETGLLKPRQDWQEIDMVTGAFGQGLSVTALQMAQAAAVIANNGKLMKPYVVKKISTGNKQIDYGPEAVRQVLKPETAATMKEMLLSAVEQGEAKRIIPKGLRVGGKTGTAQIPLNGRYDPGKTVASFVGFGPVEDPKFVMIVKFVEPVPIYGAETAEPTFFKIATDLYNYWGIGISQ